MKILKNIAYCAAIALTASLGSCQADMDTPALEVPQATMQANMTIAELKNLAAKASSDENFALLMLDKEQGYVNVADVNKAPAAVDGVVPDESMMAEYISKINPDVSTHYIIKGRVISSDASGNIYQALYIQDGTDAITLSIRKLSMYNEYRVGQEIVLDVTGLYLGKYAGLVQIGGLGVYNGTFQVSFMTAEKFEHQVQKNGLPDQNVDYIQFGSTRPENSLYCTVMTPAQLPTSAEGILEMSSQLVEFRNVSFVDGGELPYSEYQSSGVNRTITDGTSSIIVRTSGYSTFYNQIVPEGVGTVRGLLSYYNGTWQLLLRSTRDVIFDSKGNREDPYTIEEAIEKMADGGSGWVKGVVVGSVKAGVTAVTDNDQIIWGQDAERDNNVVIAPNAECKDYKLCMVVNLNQGSALRSTVNLLDNPGAYGKTLSVSGKFENMLGMAGVEPATGGVSEFELGSDQGSTPVTPPTPSQTGSGTEEDPYTIAYVQGTAATFTEDNVWVEGWIVGYIYGGSLDTGCQWTNVMAGDDTSGDGYNNNNLLLGASADSKSLTTAIPVKLRSGSNVRTELGLRAAPGAYLKHVKLKGNINKGYGTRILDAVTEYKFID
ncbi:MAG: DUF5689 domain-containing protein [Prevotella sp.]|nr:DUF5689 domain-containing protein [Bacteroides sp.]MCM1366383.1 DUF5689 domain-containing protein [Prevotella sp.]MCM1436688.1 DUF5689 domain-containing protein [Prevotella sp.]